MIDKSVISVMIGFAASCSVCGCITYTSSQEVRLELPTYDADENVITYCGYEDIAYGASTDKFADESKVAYTVSYDSVHRIPRWIAYDLTAEETTGYARRGSLSFRRDEGANVQQADISDYKGSGWTKGHMAPAADFKWSEAAMGDTFYLTNCCPQDETLNGIYWERLERRVREWARIYGIVYVVTGPIIGDAENGTLGDVTIPDAFFKAVLTRFNDSFQSVGFIMKNSSDVQPYPKCALTVNELEEAIGLDLFCGLDDAIEEDVEGVVDLRFWGF